MSLYTNFLKSIIKNFLKTKVPELYYNTEIYWYSEIYYETSKYILHFSHKPVYIHNIKDQYYLFNSFLEN